MKILINALALKNRGGSSRHLEEFIDSLQRVSSHNEYILCLDERYARQTHFQLPSLDIKTFAIKSMVHRVWIDQTQIHRLIKKEKCLSLFSLLTFGILRPPVSQTLFVRTPIYFSKRYINSIPFGQRLALNARRKWLELGIQASKFIIVPSQAMKDSILEMNDKLPLERFRVIPHGFDKERFIKALNLQSLAAPPEKSRVFNILYVSSMLPYKGFTLIPKVSSLLVEKITDFTFTFTGKRNDCPDGYDQMAEESKKLKVTDFLCHQGELPLEETYRLYAKANIFFFPSYCESFGFPMVEAMGAGLPIVAADTPVNREICGDAALYFTVGRADEAADLISQLYNNKTLRENMSAIGKKRFESNVLTMDEYVKKVLDLL